MIESQLIWTAVRFVRQLVGLKIAHHTKSNTCREEPLECPSILCTLLPKHLAFVTQSVTQKQEQSPFSLA